MPWLILSLLVQAGLIVHVIRSGRNSLWIWAIALLPLAGPLAYVAVEILPGIGRSRVAKRAAGAVRKTFDPNRELRQYQSEVRISGNVDSRRRLAEELIGRQQFDQAVEIYRQALTGLYEYDPTLMLGLARALFGKGDYRGARETLDTLIHHNPEFKSADGHLLYARALVGEGNEDKALHEYRVLSEYYPGAEAKARYAELLKRRGQHEAAHHVFKEMLDQAELAPAHYRKAQREWLDLARRELR